MGFNTTVIVLNDALDQISKDDKFGEKIADAVGMLHVSREQIDIVFGNYGNAATVVETHHADGNAVVVVGGNMANVIDTVYIGHNHHQEEGQLEILKALAKKFGYKLTKLRRLSE
jgi:hypothetical protein